MNISAEIWKRVEPLLDAGLEMDRARRSAWLLALRESHPDLHALLVSMFERHDRAERDHELETVPRLAQAPASRFAADARIGPFRLLRQLGRGGMGEVWLAEQADGRITRQVALKLPSFVESGGIHGERFARERDILARLAHPNIARLYDAGITDSGQPWLAMEYIEGEALGEHANQRSLPLAARLALLRQVLGAVGHAHRRLVVHRDLKPANILVDASGQVKLLDFGIAKLLADEAAPAPQRDITRMGGRVMTLRYAAPEQVMEGEISTATDIYALGVILHELVTGQSPYRAVREGKPFTEIALMQEDIATPSSLAPVPRDIDAILLKALRRDPAQRYASVEALDDDLVRHLESRPVLARAGNWRYLAGRFVRRHRLPIATAGALVVALAAGLVVAEGERRTAVAERQRAEKHFASVRTLANRMIVDVHGALAAVPGSLKARETLVQTSLEYLDTLREESNGNPQLMAELARAYLRIGRIQGEVSNDNLGNPAGAAANLEKGKQLLVALDRLRPNDLESLREHSVLTYQLARLHVTRGDPRWRPGVEEAVQLAERAAALPEASASDRSWLAMILADQAHLAFLHTGLSPEIESAIARAIGLQEAAAMEAPTDPTVRRRLAQTYHRAGSVYGEGTRTPRNSELAVHYLRKAVDASKSITDPETKQVTLRSELDSLRVLASMLAVVGEHAEARRIIEDVERQVTARARSDPDNVDVRVDKLVVLTDAALIGHRAGDVPRTIANARGALAIVRALPEVIRQTRDPVVFDKKAKAYLGFGLYAAAQDKGLDRARRLALLREAQPLLAEAHDFLLDVLARKAAFYDESDGRELGETRRRSEEELARLAKKG